MTVDRAQLTANLHSFYDFEGKTVLCVGAGVGQLLDQNVATAETVLIDRDPKSFVGMNKRQLTNEKRRRTRAIVADFREVNIPGDVVYFEFCLHEMDDPRGAIEHARTLAPDVVIFEHSASSEWTFYCAEDEKVARSVEAIVHFNIKRRRHVYAEQTFRDYSELVAKVSTEGDPAIQRAGRFAGVTNIVIPMKCHLVQL